MVFRRVQRREVKPVGFNLQAFSHIKAHGAKNGFNALLRQRHGVQTTLTTATTGQCHIQHFSLQVRLQLRIGQGLTTRCQSRFNGLLGHIDGSTTRLFLFDGKLRHALHELSHLARLAQELRLGIFQLSGGLCLRKQLLRALDQRIQLVHIDSLSTCKNKQGLVPFQALALADSAPVATTSLAATDRVIKQPAWPSLDQRCC